MKNFTEQKENYVKISLMQDAYVLNPSDFDVLLFQSGKWTNSPLAPVIIPGLLEFIEDTIGTKVIGGTGISVSYDDPSGNTTITNTAPYVAPSVLDTNSIDLSLIGTQFSADLRYQDSASVDLSVDASGLKATVLPAGIDHNSLNNLTVADPHTQYVKKAGDTMTGDLGFTGKGISTADYVKFNTAYAPTGLEPIGSTYWNDTDGTLDVRLNANTTMQVGQELPVKVYNDTGAQLDDGKPVYVAGRQGHVPKVALARSDAEATARVYGIVTGDISDKNYGYVTLIGQVRQIKTNYVGAGAWGTAWAVNDYLYVSKTIAGQLTNVEPTKPHHADIVAQVSVVGGIGVGAIDTNIDRHKTIGELSDVDGTAPSVTGQLLSWNQVASYWERSAYNITDYTLSTNAILKTPTAIASNTITVPGATYKGLVIARHASQTANIAELVGLTLTSSFTKDGYLNIGAQIAPSYPFSVYESNRANIFISGGTLYINRYDNAGFQIQSTANGSIVYVTTSDVVQDQSWGATQLKFNLNQLETEGLYIKTQDANAISTFRSGRPLTLTTTYWDGANSILRAMTLRTVRNSATITDYDFVIGSGEKSYTPQFKFSAQGTFSTLGANNVIQGIFKANASQTANLIECQDSSSNVLTRVNKDGWIGISASNPAAPLDITRDPGNVTTGQLRCYLVSTYTGGLTQSVGSFTIQAPDNENGAYVGFSSQSQTGGGTGSVGSLTGFSASVLFQRSSGVATNLYGAQFNVNSTGTGTVGTATGIYIGPTGNAGTMSTLYGIYVADQTSATNNYALVTNGGNVVFNESGNALTDFRVESDTEVNMLFVDANADTDGALYLGGSTNGVKIKKGGNMFFLGTSIKSGATQGGAGAATNEVWRTQGHATLPDGVLMIGI